MTKQRNLKLHSHTPSIDLGGPDQAIQNFRPQIWRHLGTDRTVLNLDLFWPIKLDDSNYDEEEEKDTNDDEDEDKDIFPYSGLCPLLTFHNLHHLQLSGMMRSYQPLIWAACWINKNLKYVHLEMALEPEIKDAAKHNIRKINAPWTYNPNTTVPTKFEYLGAHGFGTLHEEFGYGEYLDQQAMKSAQAELGHDLPIENLRYLPIKTLTLMNFVVDAGPFFRWFDPKKLREITFKGDCFDAGFRLPEDMQRSVTVNSPMPPRPMFARVVRPGEVKLIDIKPRKSQASSTSGNAAVPAESKQHGLKHKLSQMMPKLGNKAKEGGKEDETESVDSKMSQLVVSEKE
jgi:hypothetical protein